MVKKMELIIIAAVAENNVIGINGKLPWHYSEDLKRFKRLTMGFPILMGMKTFESIGKPLPGRTNIVLSDDKNFSPEGIVVCHSINEAMQKCSNSEKVFIIGGASIYKQFLQMADSLEITFVKKRIEGDAFFPQINWGDWKEMSREKFEEIDFASFKRKK
ncbi:MAG: dihydrofolate reductase [archaeon]|nr:dihydrofolate reductase [archaeon]